MKANSAAAGASVHPGTKVERETRFELATSCFGRQALIAGSGSLESTRHGRVGGLARRSPLYAPAYAPPNSLHGKQGAKPQARLWSLRTAIPMTKQRDARLVTGSFGDAAVRQDDGADEPEAAEAFADRLQVMGLGVRRVPTAQ